MRKHGSILLLSLNPIVAMKISRVLLMVCPNLIFTNIRICLKIITNKPFFTDMLSPRGPDETSLTNADISVGHVVSCLDHTEDSNTGNSARSSVSVGAKNPVSQSDPDTKEKSEPVFIDEVSCSETGGGNESLLDNCGIIPSNCLPCLASTVNTVEKRRSLSSSPPNARKKAALKLPFKSKEGHAIATLCEH